LIAHGDPPAYLTFPGLSERGLRHATTTRHCRVVTAPAGQPGLFARETGDALAPAGLDLTRAAWARQVHGTAVARAPAGGGFAGVGDILATDQPRVPLVIFTADCLAVTLHDPEVRALVVAHIGWRGLAGGGAAAAVEAACALGARPGRLQAAISPSIGPCCYEVDAPVIAALAATHGEAWRSWTAPGRPGHWMLDLWSAAETLLARAGLEPGRIENPRLCTGCHPQLFYSYRKGDHGRLLTIARI
jgi:YfiH family protein